SGHGVVLPDSLAGFEPLSRARRAEKRLPKHCLFFRPYGRKSRQSFQDDVRGSLGRAVAAIWASSRGCFRLVGSSRRLPKASAIAASKTPDRRLGSRRALERPSWLRRRLLRSRETGAQ